MECVGAVADCFRNDIIIGGACPLFLIVTFNAENQGTFITIIILSSMLSTIHANKPVQTSASRFKRQKIENPEIMQVAQDLTRERKNFCDDRINHASYHKTKRCPHES